MGGKLEAVALERIEQLCREYDSLHESYPEHPYEGWAVYAFICARLDGVPYDPEIVHVEAPQGWRERMRE